MKPGAKIFMEQECQEFFTILLKAERNFARDEGHRCQLLDTRVLGMYLCTDFVWFEVRKNQVRTSGVLVDTCPLRLYSQEVTNQRVSQ